MSINMMLPLLPLPDRYYGFCFNKVVFHGVCIVVVAREGVDNFARDGV